MERFRGSGMADFSFRVGSNAYLPDGTVVTPTFVKDNKPKPGSTEIHEATHAVNARKNGTGVEFATNVPGPGYLGLTKLTGPDSVAAVAPHVAGMDGTSHDMAIASISGNVGAAEAVARRNNITYREHIVAVAQGIETNGTLTGSQIEGIMKDVDKGPEVRLKVVHPNGDVREVRELRSPDRSTVMVPGKMFSLSPRLETASAA